MKLDIRFHGVSASHSLREHVERRCHFAFSRLAGEIASVVVRVDDVNGPRGGVDKRCRLQLTGPHVGSLHVEETAEDFYGAIDRLMDRAARAAIRAVHRGRSDRRAAPSRNTPRRLRWLATAS